MDGCKMKTERKRRFGIPTGLILLAVLFIAGDAPGYSYVIPDTDQSLCYDTLDTVSPPVQGEPFFGQDAQYESLAPSYLNNGDGTVTDLNTGLMWQQALPPEKMSWDAAVAGADNGRGFNGLRSELCRWQDKRISICGGGPSGSGFSDDIFRTVCAGKRRLETARCA